jgi:acetyltransferase-like isoleucine patch superfamily enzyme
MREQPLSSRGPIVIEDDVWLGYGVVVLSGARIGRGAVIGANSVVSGAIPPGAVAVGAPARVVRFRDDLQPVGHPNGQGQS